MDNHVDCCVVDPLSNICPVLNRLEIQHILLGLKDLKSSGSHTIRAPHFLKVIFFFFPFEYFCFKNIQGSQDNSFLYILTINSLRKAIFMSFFFGFIILSASYSMKIFRCGIWNRNDSNPTLPDFNSSKAIAFVFFPIAFAHIILAMNNSNRASFCLIKMINYTSSHFQ